MAKRRRGPLDTNTVRNIRYEHRKGFSVKRIAERYWLSERTVRRIVNYETYRADG